jgi:hypothetical protein
VLLVCLDLPAKLDHPDQLVLEENVEKLDLLVLSDLLVWLVSLDLLVFRDLLENLDRWDQREVRVIAV